MEENRNKYLLLVAKNMLSFDRKILLILRNNSQSRVAS